jgi:hypothetical protein
LERDLKQHKGDSCMLLWRGYVSRLVQCTRSAVAVGAGGEHDEERPEHDDDGAADDNAAEVVAVVAEAGRTFVETADVDADAAVAVAAVDNERPIVAAQTSRKSREGRDRRWGSAAYYYLEL